MKTKAFCSPRFSCRRAPRSSRPRQSLNKIRDYFLDHEKDAIESVSTIAGYSFSGRTQNNGLVFVKLKDWKLRDRLRN